jgi:hypothetical protein
MELKLGAMSDVRNIDSVLILGLEKWTSRVRKPKTAEMIFAVMGMHLSVIF